MLPRRDTSRQLPGRMCAKARKPSCFRSKMKRASSKATRIGAGSAARKVTLLLRFYRGALSAPLQLPPSLEQLLHIARAGRFPIETAHVVRGVVFSAQLGVAHPSQAVADLRELLPRQRAVRCVLGHRHEYSIAYRRRAGGRRRGASLTIPGAPRTKDHATHPAARSLSARTASVGTGNSLAAGCCSRSN